MSGLFVLAIALHTFMQVMMGRQLKHRTFVAIVVGLWVVGVILVIIPIAIVGPHVWMPSVAWVCTRKSPRQLNRYHYADVLTLLSFDSAG